jgi:hypothetical protein
VLPTGSVSTDRRFITSGVLTTRESSALRLLKRITGHRPPIEVKNGGGGGGVKKNIVAWISAA